MRAFKSLVCLFGSLRNANGGKNQLKRLKRTHGKAVAFVCYLIKDLSNFFRQVQNKLQESSHSRGKAAKALFSDNRSVSMPHLHNFLDVYASTFNKEKKMSTRLKR